MQKLFPSLLLDVSDSLLSDTILEVSIHAAISDVLLLLLAVVDKCLVSKSSIVTVVLLYVYSVVGSKTFKGLLCSDCLFRR